MRKLLAVLVLGPLGAIAFAQGTPSTNVTDMVKAYQDAYNAGDAEAVARLFATDGWLSDASGAVSQGRDAILAFVRQDIATNMTGDAAVTLKLTTDEEFGPQEAPAGRGSWEAVGQDGTSLGGGQWVVVTENVNGQPLIHWLITNVVLPPSMTGRQ